MPSPSFVPPHLRQTQRLTSLNTRYWKLTLQLVHTHHLSNASRFRRVLFTTQLEPNANAATSPPSFTRFI